MALAASYTGTRQHGPSRYAGRLHATINTAWDPGRCCLLRRHCYDLDARLRQAGNDCLKTDFTGKILSHWFSPVYSSLGNKGISVLAWTQSQFAAPWNKSAVGRRRRQQGASARLACRQVTKLLPCLPRWRTVFSWQRRNSCPRTHARTLTKSWNSKIYHYYCRFYRRFCFLEFYKLMFLNVLMEIFSFCIQRFTFIGFRNNFLWSVFCSDVV